MKYVAHYFLLVFVILASVYYWFVTTQTLVRVAIDQGFPEAEDAATGIVWFLLHPVVAYAVLLSCCGLLIKEFVGFSLKKRFLWNLIFLGIVFFLFSVHSFRMVTN